MRKAVLACAATLAAGVLALAAGHELLGGFPEFGPVVAVAVMGAFIIFFNEKKK